MFFNCRHPSHTTTNQISAISAHVKQQHHHDDARSSCLQFFLRKNGFDMCCTRRLKFHARNHGWICSVAAAVVVVVAIHNSKDSRICCAFRLRLDAFLSSSASCVQSFVLSFFARLSQNARRPVITSTAIFEGEQERSMCLLITSPTDILATSKLRKRQSEFDTHTDRSRRAIVPSRISDRRSCILKLGNRQ
jgi:hypothetical protein